MRSSPCALDLEASQVRVPAHEDELHRGESVGVRDDLRHDGEPRGNFFGCQGPQVGAIEVNVAALHAKHAGNGPQEGGLARAVGANQPHHLPVGRIQVDAVKQRFGLNLKEDALRANRRWPAVFHHCLLRKAECGRGWVGKASGHNRRARSSAPRMFQYESVVKCLLSTT